MVLVLDVGNSVLKGGIFDKSTLTDVFTISIGPDGSPQSEESETWRQVLARHMDPDGVERIGLASVVPSVSASVIEAVETATGAPCTLVQPDVPLPFDLEYETPETLGADRLAAAAAGWVQFGRPGEHSVLVVDAGTAVTYEVIHREGIYQGGAIAAGPGLIRTALRSETAQLPEAPHSVPASSVGRSTETALQSGIMWSVVDSIRGMTDRLADTLPDTPTLVQTGGWSRRLLDHLPYDHHAPHLVLHGIRTLIESSDA